jgi:hypothetical protein
MFGRFNRLVPPHHREMLRRLRLSKPNWYVGAAEHAPVAYDPELAKDIEDLKTELREKAKFGAEKKTAATTTASTTRTSVPT